MRYIYTVIGIILVFALVAGVTLLKSQPSPSKEALRVNDRIITMEEFGKAYDERAATAPGPVDKRRFLDDLITKEILIQEAKRLHLDLEEPFRRTIQNYYEQTLLRNLTQKKMSDISVSVTEEEIGLYYRDFGKVFDLSVVYFPTEQQAKEAAKDFPVARAEKKVLHMDEIPHDMLEAVTALKAGEVSEKPVRRERGFLVFRLDRYTSESVPPLSSVREEIRKTLEEQKRRVSMEKWLEGLKKNSRITINDSLAKQEGL